MRGLTNRLWLLGLILAVSHGVAQPLNSKAALARLFTDAPRAAWFTEDFLAAAPLVQINAVLAQLTGELGRYERVEGTENPFTVRFVRGTADAPLAVGSTFKLAVLSALDDEVAAGRRAWDEVVRLRPEWRSLPSGVLQDWPTGSPVTLATLATLMISASDNTATDALLAVLTRERVAAKGGRNRPFLTTREAFALKSSENRGLLRRYREGGAAARRGVLAERGPAALDAEWFFTVRELCALMAEVQRLPLTRVNPGVADPAAWTAVSYKGGSEPGVLNATTWLTREDGREVCVPPTHTPQVSARFKSRC